MAMMSSGGRGGSSCGGRGDGVAFGMAELAELGGDVPNGEAGVGIEDGVDVPGGLAGGDGDEGVVAGLPPGPDILAALLVGPPQRVGALLVQAVQGVAVHVVPHLGLVYVARPCLLCEPKHFVCHLHACMHPNSTSFTNILYKCNINRTLNMPYNYSR